MEREEDNIYTYKVSAQGDTWQEQLESLRDPNTTLNFSASLRDREALLYHHGHEMTQEERDALIADIGFYKQEPRYESFGDLNTLGKR